MNNYLITTIILQYRTAWLKIIQNDIMADLNHLANYLINMKSVFILIIYLKTKSVGQYCITAIYYFKFDI